VYECEGKRPDVAWEEKSLEGLRHFERDETLSGKRRISRKRSILGVVHMNLC
jgi:hypothetical protein